MQTTRGPAKDVLAGLLYLAVGAAFAVGATRYPLGTIVRIGAGTFPMILALLLMVVGVAVLLDSFARGAERVGGIAWRGLAAVVAAVLLFAGLAESGGLGLATFTAALVGAAGSPEVRWGRAILLALGLAVGCVIVFVHLLGLPLTALPRFMGP